MSLLNFLVDYCNEHYASHVQCGYPCEHCDQPERCASHGIEERDCMKCCDDIHFHHNGGRADYTCDHLFDYYVCRYSYKYCSEILYAFEQVNDNDYPFFNILSLGCGPSPDLMAFENKYVRGLSDKPIKYLGIDMNNGWDRIHDKITEYCEDERNIEVDFHYDDVISLLNRGYNFDGCNVIIVSYLISHLINTGQFEMLDAFFDGVVENIVQLRNPNTPMLIIINDADSVYTGRDRFWDLDRKIRSAGMATNTIAKCFSPIIHFPNATRHQSNKGKFYIPNEVMNKYKCAYNCNGAQLIIEVR